MSTCENTANRRGISLKNRDTFGTMAVRGLLAGLLALLAACGKDKPITLAISPSAYVVEAGGTVELVVTAQNTDVVWPNSIPGSFSRAGNRITYTPPAAEGSYEFTVAASADPARAVTASIQVFVPPNPEITAFSLEGLAPAIIDQDTNTIVFSTHQWIEGLAALKATFSAVGKVTIDGVEQASGSTSNNFYRDVRYTVSTGEFARRTYVVRIDSPQTTGLPVVSIDTEDGQAITSKEDYLQANIAVVDPADPAHDFTKTGYKEQVRGRGNSTWTYPKKPYRIKFDKKTSMLGLVEAKSWVLLANYQDPTLMLNAVAMELGQRFGLPYTTHPVPVELFLNGQYQGNYTLTEHIQVGEGRVEVDEDAGFMVELDVYYDEEPKFTTVHYGLPVMIKSPEDLEDPAGYDFVKDAIHVLETAMVGASFPDSGYRNLIYMGTFVDFMLINEMVMNAELGWPKSTYMYRDAGRRIGMGPLWDFDWGYGYAGGGHQYFTGFSWLIGKHPFFARFFQDPVFLARYKDRWVSMREQVATMPGYIDSLAERLQKSQEQNFWRWPEAGNNGYEKEIGDLKAWWKNRMEYLDTAIAAMN